MRGKHVTAIFWVPASIVAFGLGWGLKPAPESPDTVAVATGTRGAAASSAGGLISESQAARPAPDAGMRSELRVLSVSSRALSRADIEDLGGRFRKSLDPIERRLAFTKLLQGLTVENAREIREQIAGLDPRSREFQDFHYAWGKIAGAEAVMNGARTDGPDMGPALAGWASANPSAAIAWFNGLDMANDTSFDSLLKDRGISESDVRNHLVEGLVQGLANRDLDMAVSFVGDLAAAADGQAGRMMQLVANSAYQLMGQEGAARWAETLSSGLMQTAGLEQIAKNWASSDPDAASAWAESLGQGYQDMSAVSAAFGKWGAGAAGADPAVAAAYLRDLPDSPNRDLAINGFISGQMWIDPEAAVIWAQDIRNPGLREAAVVRAGQRYFASDPAGAARWLAGSGLPESTRKKLPKTAP